MHLESYIEDLGSTPQIPWKMMDEIIESGKPTVLDVIIDSEEPPLMKSRVASLEKVYD